MKKILSTILNIALWIIILVSALFAFTTLATKDSNSVGNIAGFTPLTVATNSMSPTFTDKDLIIIKKVDPAALKEGDIITFHAIIENQYALNTHRITKVTANADNVVFNTKGDNNPIEDNKIVSSGDVVGKYVCKVPNVGTLMKFLSSSLGFLLIIILPLLAFFIYQVYNLVLTISELKKVEKNEELNKESDAKLEEAKRILEEAKKMKEEAEQLKKGE